MKKPCRAGIKYYEVMIKAYVMKIFSTKVHGVMDYLMGVILIAVPWLFNFARGGAETWVPVILGTATILYSLITDYEYSVAKVISMRTHLNLDLFSGIFLAASPWVFGFKEFVYLPHLILGILEVVAVLMSESVPSTSTNRTTHRHVH
jgi:hypothetical protein